MDSVKKTLLINKKNDFLNTLIIHGASPAIINEYQNMNIEELINGWLNQALLLSYNVGTIVVAQSVGVSVLNFDALSVIYKYLVEINDIIVLN